MTVDASRSCLGLGTCVGSVTRQIVEARVLLTATAPPALLGRSVSDGSLASPLDAITRFLGSFCRRYLPGDRAAFDRDPPLQSHIYRHVMMVGEAAWSLSQALKDQNPQVPWKQIEGMRHPAAILVAARAGNARVS